MENTNTEIIAEFKNEEDGVTGVVAAWNENGLRVFSAGLRDEDSGKMVAAPTSRL